MFNSIGKVDTYVLTGKLTWLASGVQFPPAPEKGDVSIVPFAEFPGVLQLRPTFMPPGDRPAPG